MIHRAIDQREGGEAGGGGGIEGGSESGGGLSHEFGHAILLCVHTTRFSRDPSRLTLSVTADHLSGHKRPLRPSAQTGQNGTESSSEALTSLRTLLPYDWRRVRATLPSRSATVLHSVPASVPCCKNDRQKRDRQKRIPGGIQGGVAHRVLLALVGAKVVVAEAGDPAAGAVRAPVRGRAGSLREPHVTGQASRTQCALK